MKKILITGRTSFIGRNIFESLSKETDQYEIYAPGHLEMDLTDEEKTCCLLKEGKFDYIIHAAMYNKYFDHPNMLSDSLRIFLNLEKCNEYYGRMYYFGSGAEFDKTKDITSVREEAFGRSIPKNYYGFAKYIMSKHAMRSDNIVNLRLFGVYGKYEDWKTKFISNAICRTIIDKPITLSQNVFFDYMYIDDLCDVVKKFLVIEPKHKDYNVCSGKRLELLSLAQKVLEISQKELKIVLFNKGLKPEYTACNDRMIKEIAYNPTNIDNGIKNLYKWYEDNFSSLNIMESSFD